MPKPAPPTFAPDARLAGLIVVPSRGFRENTYLERPDRATAIAIHTTGSGPLRRFANARERVKYGYTDPFDAGCRIYRDVMDAGPHYVSGQLGQRAQVCPEHLAAWHVGSRGSAPYTAPNGEWAKPGEHDWWFERWGRYGITSPFELANGTLWEARLSKPFRMGIRTGFSKFSCNDNTIGWEVVPDIQRPRGPWSNKCWEGLVEGVLEVAGRNEIPISPLHIGTHSDFHPLARSARNQGWDPAPSQWSWKRFADVAGIAA